MSWPYPGIGVVFDIDALGSGLYGVRAWRILMRHLDPQRLCACLLVEGDTSPTLAGRANDFCVGFYNVDPQYIRDRLADLPDAGLAPPHRRFMEKLALDLQPLVTKGQIDGLGRLRTEQWTYWDHQLCKEMGWGFRPQSVPDGLDPDLKAELEKLGSVRLG